MSTADLKVNLYLKKFLSQQEHKDNFIDYLHKISKDGLKRIYELGGTFKGGVLSSSLADTFDISTPCEGINSQGLDIILNPSQALQIPFENSTVIDYFVGIKPIEIPNGTEINPKTGQIEYTFFKEINGIKGEPDSIIDNGNGTMTIVVDSVTEASVSNAGRTVRVWLKPTDDGGTIGAQTEALPFEDIVVVWDATNNKITTTSNLGQTTISTDVTEYQVALLGVTVKRNTDIRLDSSIVFLGIITGDNGTTPSIFDQTDKIILPSLYDFLVEHNADGTHNWNQVLYDIVVGSAAQVTSGEATHTIDTFAAAVVDENTILFLTEVETATANINLGSKRRLIIESQPGASINLNNLYSFTSSGAGNRFFIRIRNVLSPEVVTISGIGAYLFATNTVIDTVNVSNGSIAICAGINGGIKRSTSYAIDVGVDYNVVIAPSGGTFETLLDYIADGGSTGDRILIVDAEIEDIITPLIIPSSRIYKFSQGVAINANFDCQTAGINPLIKIQINTRILGSLVVSLANPANPSQLLEIDGDNIIIDDLYILDDGATIGDLITLNSGKKSNKIDCRFNNISGSVTGSIIKDNSGEFSNIITVRED